MYRTMHIYVSHNRIWLLDSLHLPTVQTEKLVLDSPSRDMVVRREPALQIQHTRRVECILLIYDVIELLFALMSGSKYVR